MSQNGEDHKIIILNLHMYKKEEEEDDLDYCNECGNFYLDCVCDI